MLKGFFYLTGGDVNMQESYQLRTPQERVFVRLPKPSHRHAAPAGPWPYIDTLTDQESEEVIDAKIPAIIGSCGHDDDCQDCKQWIAYPQSLFSIWTIKPVRHSGLERVIRCGEDSSVIYTVDVLENGVFGDSGTVTVTSRTKRDYWNNTLLPERKPGIRVRAMFVDKMSGPILQMLGTRYIVEPFFFSSSINWIPSRYQENAIPKKGDHITITLSFVRTMQAAAHRHYSTLIEGSTTRSANGFGHIENLDTRAPLVLRSDNKILHLDFLGIHMIRDAKGSTIISYHHDINGSTTSAEDLFTRLKLVGCSVYWQLIIRNSQDPTFVFLAILWNALYAWDEALETLYEHFCWLESRVITTDSLRVDMTYELELHVIRAYLLYYVSLLSDFRKSVEFIRDTHNPAMDNDDIDDTTRAHDKTLLKRECANLLSEIHRLEMNRTMQDERVQNVKNLVYSSINIGDSNTMKHYSYVAMMFLPASFVASLYGMNVVELNAGTYGKLSHYMETAMLFTVLTIWLTKAFESRFIIQDERPMWTRLLWPILLFVPTKKQDDVHH